MLNTFLELPTDVDVKCRKFNIASKGDWRTMIKCSNALSKDETPNDIKVPAILTMFYDELTIDNLDDYAEYLDELIKCMFFILAYGNLEVKQTVKPTINYEKDIRLIVEAISKEHSEVRTTTSVDIVDEQGFPKGYIHWWTFLSYLNSCTDTTLNTILGLRYKINNGKKLNKEEREFVSKNKKLMQV